MSLLSASTMKKCQELIDKVSEFRYLKVIERQINKFGRLLQRKEGNITWSARTQVNNASLAVSVSSPQAGSTSSQAISIASRAVNTNNTVSFSLAGIVSSNSTNNNPQVVSPNSQGGSAVPPGR